MAEVMLAPSSLPGRLAFSPDGALLAAGAVLIDVPNGRVLRVFRGQLSPVTGAAFSPDGTLLATASFDGNVRVWDAAHGTVRADITLTADDFASDVAFSPDGTVLAGACDDSETVRLWDPRTGRALATFDIGADATCVDFSPDGQLLAVGSLDWTARIWDARAGTLRTTLTCEELVYVVAFSPEGALLATASSDRSVWVWDLATATARTVIRSPDWVSSVVFLPGGRYLATATNTGTARIWDVSADPVTTTPAVTLAALAGNGYAALLPGGGFKLSGDAGDRLWWLDGLRRLAPGELGAPGDGTRRLPEGARLLPGA